MKHLQSVGGHQVIPRRARKLKPGMRVITDDGYATIAKVVRIKGAYTGSQMFRITFVNSRGVEVLHEEGTINTVIVPDWQSTCSPKVSSGIERLRNGIIPPSLDDDTANRLRKLRDNLPTHKRPEVSGIL